MGFLDKFTKMAQEKNARLVLPEGEDPRILTAARQMLDQKIARPILLGSTQKILKTAQKLNLNIDDMDLREPLNADDLGDYTRICVQKLQKKSESKPDPDQVMEWVKTPLFYGGMMVDQRKGEAMIAGVAHPTAEVIRAGLKTVGLAKGNKTVSGFFLMRVPEFQGQKEKMFIFADCAVVIDPDVTQLADIAIASARNAALLLEETPKVALLSFSTKGSAKHQSIDKINDSLAQIHHRAPDIIIDGEFQADTALIADIAAHKLKTQSAVAGQANVLIFPDLEAGNIGYKLVQYMGGAQAIGPFLQGFAKPICDLSRGACVADIVCAATITLALNDQSLPPKG